MPQHKTSDTLRPPRRRFELGRLRAAELYDAWMFAEVDASLALAAWRSADRADKPARHAGYLAALDREAHAAAVLAQRLLGSR